MKKGGIIIKNERILFMTRSAVIAAMYVVLTVLFAPISFGTMQVRIAEILTVLPMFTPAAVPGLFIGCILGNLLGGAVIWDTVFGSLATLIGAVGAWAVRKNRWLVPLSNIAANTLIVPFILRYAYNEPLPIYLLMVYVLAGEMISCYLIGELFITVLLKQKKLFSKYSTSE